MSDLNDDPYDVAKAKGLVVVEPGDYDLLLDIDTAPDWIHMNAMLSVLSDLDLAFKVVAETVSEHGRQHVYIRTLFPLTPELRIAFQAALGSDRKRELLSLLRIVLKLNRPPTVLFETVAPVITDTFPLGPVAVTDPGALPF